MLQYIINAEIVKVEQLQNFPDIQPGGDGHAVIDHQDEILSLLNVCMIKCLYQVRLSRLPVIFFVCCLSIYVFSV